MLICARKREYGNNIKKTLFSVFFLFFLKNAILPSFLKGQFDIIIISNKQLNNAKGVILWFIRKADLQRLQARKD